MGTYVKVYSDELAHHGIKGQKWGVRRYQNKDGSLTPAGRKRQAKEDLKTANKEYSKAYNKAYNYSARHPIGQYVSKKKKQQSDENWGDAYDKAQKANDAKTAYKKVKEDIKSERRAAKSEYKNAKRAADAERRASIDKSSDKFDAVNDKYKKGQISKVELEAARAKDVKNLDAAITKYQITKAEAKKAYQIAKGMDVEKADAKFQRKMKNINSSKNSLYEDFVKDTVMNEPDIAESLVKMGTMKSSEVTKAYKAIQAELETEKAMTQIHNSSLQSENARLRRELDELKRQNG